MRLSLCLLCLLGLFQKSIAATTYDSTYNFIDKMQVQMLLGQTLIVLDSPKYSSGFSNLFWSNKRGRIYGGRKHTPLEAVANKRLKVVDIVSFNPNPILHTIDENGVDIFVNYQFVSDTYYPFLIDGYWNKIFSETVGYSFFLDKDNNDFIACYRSKDNRIYPEIHDVYSKWSCVRCVYDDSSIFKEIIELQNYTYGLIKIPYKDFKKFFRSEVDANKIRYLDSLKVRYAEIEREFQSKIAADTFDCDTDVGDELEKVHQTDKRSVGKSSLKLGMSKIAAFSVLGTPEDYFSTETVLGDAVIWYYYSLGVSLNFIDGKLVSIDKFKPISF